MDTIPNCTSAICRFQIYLPMQNSEMNALNAYLRKSGYKKGAFIRRAIMNELLREEQRQDRDILHVLKD